MKQIIRTRRSASLRENTLIYFGGPRFVVAILFFLLHMVSNSWAVAAQDQICLRNGHVLFGTIASETDETYSLVDSQTWPPATTNVPVRSVRYVVYGTPDKAKKALELEDTIRKLSLRDEASVEFLPTIAFGEAIVRAASNATKRIWIMAYYITGSSYPAVKAFYELLREKARAGLDVRIISEFGTGTPMPVRNGTLNFASTLRTDGVKIGFIQEYKTMHKKTILLDDDIVIVGSGNLTAAGTVFNDEFNVLIRNRTVANEVEKDFLRMSERAKRVEELK